MYHVLEHVLDPHRVHRKIRNIISPDGVLCIGVPNMAMPDEDISKFFRIEHCFYFVTETLEKLLTKSGFEVLEMVITKTDIRLVAKL